MTIIGYRQIGGKLIKVFEVTGKKADEKSRRYIEALGFPVEEDYIEEYARSNFYMIYVKVFEDGTRQIIDLAYHAKKGSYQGHPFPPKAENKQENGEKEVFQRINEKQKAKMSSKTKMVPKEPDIEALIRPEGVTVEELMSLTDRSNPLDRLISTVERRYSEAWEKEPLVYADGYIRFLRSAGDYYANVSQTPNPFAEWLREEVGIKYPSPAEDALRYYRAAAHVATRVSFIYFPRGKDPDNAEKYLKIAVELAEKMISLGDSDDALWVYFNNLGIHYYETYQSEKALPPLEKALQYAQSADGRVAIFHNLALVNADLGNVDRAVEYMVRSICLHYDTLNEYGDISHYNKDIERLTSMIDDGFTDLLALWLSPDLIGGNFRRGEACEYLKEIPPKWPLARAVRGLLCQGDSMESGQYPYGECEKLLKDLEKAAKLT